MLEKQRHLLLETILARETFASVRSLSDELDISEATIRRDINKLHQDKKLKKIRGGAEAIVPAGERRQLAGNAFDVSREVETEIKRRIAKKAVEICNDGESIIINGGTTTYMMGEYLVKRNIDILTNSFKLAQYLAENGDNQVTLPGGEIYRKQGIVLSSFENDTIQYYHSSIMFMGTQGITPIGVTESDALLIRAEQKLRKRADQLIVLADNTKIGKQGSFIFCLPEQVDTLITDDKANPGILDQLRDRGVKVIIA